MDRERELKIVRRAYGKQVTAAAGVGDPQVERRSSRCVTRA